jgi:4-hydroxybenzoate polyprenyltransferase
MSEPVVVLPLMEPWPIWARLFVIACGAMFAGCLYHAIKMGQIEYRQSCDRGDRKSVRITYAISQPALLIGFAVFYYFLESAARAWTPYFVYSAQFPDRILLFPFEAAQSPAWHQPVDTACTRYVRALVESSSNHTIPASVLLMESALTYASMWTAMILVAGRSLATRATLPRYWVVPCWSALFVLAIDALLDPVVAAKYGCDGVAWGDRGEGVGLWHWFVPSPRAEHPLAVWFGVPAFNYAAWWAAPMVAISTALFLQRLRAWISSRLQVAALPPGVEPAPRPSARFFLVPLIALPVYVLVQISRFSVSTLPGSRWLQWGVLAIALAASAYPVLRELPHFTTRGGEQLHDPNLSLPPIVFLALPVSLLLGEGLFLEVPGLVAVGFVCLLLVVLFTLWPYEKEFGRLVASVVRVDRFIRVAYFGFPALMTLLGAAAVALHRLRGEIELDLSKWVVGGLLTAALAFHIFAYVHNDVVDYDVDKTQPKRQRDPLVERPELRGNALAFAWVQVPIAFGVAFVLNGGAGRPWPLALPYAALLAGFALMWVYNKAGKRCPVPVLTDAAQALAWGMLALFGALVMDPLRMSENWILVWTLMAFGGGFILIVSGVSGGLRDLVNDERTGCRTTALWLGAREVKGEVRSSRKLVVYAFAVQTAMFAAPAWVLYTASEPGGTTGIELSLLERWLVAGILAVHLLCCSRLLWHVVRECEPRREHFIGRHSLVLMQTALWAFAPVMLGFTVFWVLAVLFYGPLLANRAVLRSLLRFTHPRLVRELALED